MSRRLSQIALAALGLLAAAQLVRPARTNPSTDPTRTIRGQLPRATGMTDVVDRSCRDCHTHETRWPWYSEVAPISWLVAHDVAEGREAVNFSDWAGYDPARQRALLKKACEEVTEGGMPIRSYTWLHPDAGLAQQDVAAICAVSQAADAPK